MKVQKLIVTLVTIVLIGSLFAGAVNATGESTSETISPVAALQNVRDYAPTASAGHSSYLVDGGKLYASSAESSTGANELLTWTEVVLPTDVMAGVVASTDSHIYVGAANEMVLYRSQNEGRTWQRFALGSDVVGGITAVAVDNAQKVVYVGTDMDGVYRLRDVGSSMTINGHLILDEQVVEIATDSAGAGLAFVRTASSLFRAENMGLNWVEVENLGSVATAIAVTNVKTEFLPATVFVGTADRGLLQSVDGGYTWQTANSGLNMAAGIRLFVNALAVDPTAPEVLYVSTSYLSGSTTVMQSAGMVAMSNNSAATWASLGSDVANGALVDDLMPVAGKAGAVYALSTQSRSPFALGTASDFANAIVVQEVSPLASLVATAQQNLAWLLATLSALTLMVIAVIDFRNNHSTGRKEDSEQAGPAGNGVLGLS